MKLPALFLSTLLLLGIPCLHAQLPVAPKQDTAQPKKPREMPKAEWLDPNHEAPNGAQYKTFASKVLGQDVSYLVWLPPDYEQGTKRYPVIYWLHGWGGNQRAGAMMFVPHIEAAIKEGVLPPAIAVLVNGMGWGAYCDAPNGQRPIESVIIRDLIPHVDAAYRTLAKREGRVIEGYSMGGYGTAHLGFKYPELFGTVVINAAALVEDKWVRAEDQTGQLLRQNADALRSRTHIRIGCGSLDDLLPRNQELHELLTQLGIEHQWQVVPDVGHNAKAYYDKLGTKAFEFHRKSLAPPDAGK